MTNSEQKQSADGGRWKPFCRTWLVVMLQCFSFAFALPAQTVTPNSPEQAPDKQINVNWLYGYSVTSLGDGLLGWEPRYDLCRCDGFWPRTRHAIVRNFVTYDRSEKSLRPQLLPYLGAFTGSVAAIAWTPGNSNWQVRGYQAVITQIPVGMGINWIGEFAPDIMRVLHRK
jgi:hypothetical protein